MKLLKIFFGLIVFIVTMTFAGIATLIVTVISVFVPESFWDRTIK